MVVWYNQTMEDKALIAIIHGRFQPPHNGHLKYILEALKQTEHLFVGICTPQICTPEESTKTGYPCTEELNPFTYQERVDMLRASLKEAGANLYDCSFIPFPSDYKNISELIPRVTVFLMSVTSPHDTKKIEYIKSLGYKVKPIIEINDAREESGEKIRNSIKNKTDEWKKLVPPAVVEFISKKNSS